MNAITHVAAAPDGKIQRCARCGVVLADSHVPGHDAPRDYVIPHLIARGPYPIGASVEVSPHHAAQVMGGLAPYCQPTSQAERIEREYAEAAR